MPSLTLYLRNGICHYRGTIAKRRLRGSTGIPKAQKDLAKRAVAKLETRQWECHHDGPGAVLTFAKAAMMYRAAGKSDPFLEAVEDYLKDTLVKDITPDTVIAMTMELYGHCTGTSRNRMGITPTQAVINYVADSARLCPRIRVKRFKSDTKEKPHATLDWIKAFMKQASPQLGGYALFMFLTGARPTEALRCDIDIPDATALIHESKIGHERRAHLPEMLVATLANIPCKAGRPIFFYRNLSDLKGAWNSAVKRAGIRRMTMHSCRHGFITGLLRRGIDVKTTAWLADMTVETLVKTYAHAIKDRTLTNVLLDPEIDTRMTRSSSENSGNQRKTATT
jgi:integrase